MSKQQDKWSIQISKKTQNELKKFCKENGYKMCRFVEIAIFSQITGSISGSLLLKNR